MPSQLFRVTRALEAESMTPQQILRMISVERDDSEWDVQEMELLPARVVSVEHAAALRRKSNAERDLRGDSRVGFHAVVSNYGGQDA